MKKVLYVLLIGLLLLAACTPARSPEDIVTELGAAINRGDLDAAMALTTDDIVFNSAGELHEGPDAVRTLFEDLVAINFRIEQEIVSVNGQTVMSKTRTWADPVPQELLPFVADEEYILQGDHISRITWTPTAETVEKMQNFADGEVTSD